MKIINNQDLLLIDEAKQLINQNSTIYISCNHFTGFALFELIEPFSKAKQINFLLSNNFKSEDDFRFIQSEAENKLNLLLDRKYRINPVIGLIDDKIQIRKGGLGNQNILIVENDGVSNCFSLTPMDLDSVCLGILTSETPIFITSFEDSSNQYLTLFKNSWDNSRENLNDSIKGLLEKGTNNISAEAIYKYSIREIFHYSTVNERADEKLEKTGFKNSKIWSLLYNFQKDAVIGAIDKIETYGGCIIADSVGLGKTFEALAVIKYYLLRNDQRVLLLAPKKLRENWTVYTLNDKRNILAEDRLNFDVLNHTDLTRERGKSGDIDLETIHWGNYDLVVIDESHNFRNNPNKRDGMTRYKRLMNHVIKSNIRTSIGQKELNQIDKYAYTIEKHSSLPNDKVKYKLILVSSKLNDYAKSKMKSASETHKKPFLYDIKSEKNIEIYVIEWKELIEQNKRKLNYLSSKLTVKDVSVKDKFEVEYSELIDKKVSAQLRKVG